MLTLPSEPRSARSPPTSDNVVASTCLMPPTLSLECSRIVRVSVPSSSADVWARTTRSRLASSIFASVARVQLPPASARW